ARRRGTSPRCSSRYQDEGAENSLINTSPPGQQSGRGTRLTLGSSAEPEEASGRLHAESQIEPWSARARPQCWQCGGIGSSNEENDAEKDCPAAPKTPLALVW